MGRWRGEGRRPESESLHASSLHCAPRELRFGLAAVDQTAISAIYGKHLVGMIPVDAELHPRATLPDTPVGAEETDTVHNETVGIPDGAGIVAASRGVVQTTGDARRRIDVVRLYPVFQDTFQCRCHKPLSCHLSRTG